MQHGSLTNHLMANAAAPVKPEVGMGATYIGWSDRHPYTIVWVAENGRRCEVQADDAKRTDKNGMSDAQSYEFTPNPNNRKLLLSLRKDGTWRVVGDTQQFLIGHREEYYDYSF